MIRMWILFRIHWVCFQESDHPNLSAVVVKTIDRHLTASSLFPETQRLVAWTVSQTKGLQNVNVNLETHDILWSPVIIAIIFKMIILKLYT